MTHYEITATQVQNFHLRKNVSNETSAPGLLAKWPMIQIKWIANPGALKSADEL